MMRGNRFASWLVALLTAVTLSAGCGKTVGDTIDDHKTVLNYRELKGAGKAKIIACTALSGPSGEAHRRLFLEAGAEIVTPDANMLLQYIGKVMGNG